MCTALKSIAARRQLRSYGTCRVSEEGLRGVGVTAAESKTPSASLEEPPRPRRGKRKIPVPDWDAIEDPDELRLQKRLVKNRRTAAASR